MQPPENKRDVIIRPLLPWLIPAAAAFAFPLMIVFLNMLFNNQSGIAFLDIDYPSHSFLAYPYVKSMGLDTTVINGTRWVFWGTALIMLLVFFPNTGHAKKWNILVSDFANFMTVGCLIFYFISIYCLWLLAIFEGYANIVFKYFSLYHAPWRFIGHLAAQVQESFIPIGYALFLSWAGFLFKMNLRSFIYFCSALLLFFLHLHTHIWLVD